MFKPIFAGFVNPSIGPIPVKARKISQFSKQYSEDSKFGNHHGGTSNHHILRTRALGRHNILWKNARAGRPEGDNLKTVRDSGNGPRARANR